MSPLESSNNATGADMHAMITPHKHASAGMRAFAHASTRTSFASPAPRARRAAGATENVGEGTRATHRTPKHTCALPLLE